MLKELSISRNILTDQKLTATDKLLYGFLKQNSISGKFLATDGYLAYMIGTDASSIRKSMVKLKSFKFIQTFNLGSDDHNMITLSSEK